MTSLRSGSQTTKSKSWVRQANFRTGGARSNPPVVLVVQNRSVELGAAHDVRCLEPASLTEAREVNRQWVLTEVAAQDCLSPGEGGSAAGAQTRCRSEGFSFD